MTPRSRPEWVGKRPESMPGTDVLLRLYARQNGLCACGCGRVMNLNRDKVDCDHKLPLRDGGLNVESNLQLMLHEHHIAKTSEENSGRAKAKRYQARAFERRSSSQSRGFPKAQPRHSATAPLSKGVGIGFQEGD